MYNQHYIRLVMELCAPTNAKFAEWDADLRDFLLGRD